MTGNQGQRSRAGGKVAIIVAGTVKLRGWHCNLPYLTAVLSRLPISPRHSYISAICWWTLGHGFAYGKDVGGFIGTDHFFFTGSRFEEEEQANGTAQWFFQWAFAGECSRAWRVPKCVQSFSAIVPKLVVQNRVKQAYFTYAAFPRNAMFSLSFVLFFCSHCRHSCFGCGCGADEDRRLRASLDLHNFLHLPLREWRYIGVMSTLPS